MKHDTAIIEAAKATSSIKLKDISAAAAPAPKVGRPRKEGVTRYANGQIKRSAREEDVRAVVVEQRARHRGVSLAAATDPRLASPLGRLNMNGHLGPDQYTALAMYIGAVMKLRAVEGFRPLTPHAARVWDGEVGRGFGATPNLKESDDRVEWIGRLRCSVDEARAAVTREGGSDARGWLQAVEAFCDDTFEEDAYIRRPRVMCCIKLLAAALIRHYRLGGRR